MNNNNDTNNIDKFDSQWEAGEEADARIAEDDQNWVVAYVNDGNDGYWIVELDS